ncbi:MAG: hypothetical protein ABJ387_09400 [Balneola sp.]
MSSFFAIKTASLSQFSELEVISNSSLSDLDSIGGLKFITDAKRNNYFKQLNFPSKGDDHPNSSLDDPRDVVKFMNW